MSDPTSLPTPARLSPRTPWPAAGVALRLGISLALLAVTVPLLYRAGQASEIVRELHAAPLPAGMISTQDGRFSTTGAATTPLRVSIRSELNTLNLSAGPATGSAPGLQAAYSGNPVSGTLLADQDGRRVSLRVRLRGPVLRLDPGVLNVQVNPATPLSLDIQGRGETRLDLRRTVLSDLRLHQDLGETRVSFPAQGEYRADLQPGVGTATLTFPAGDYRARLRVRSDLGSVEVHVPAGANVHLQARSDLGSVERPDRLSQDAAAGPDLTLDLSTRVGTVSVVRDLPAQDRR